MDEVGEAGECCGMAVLGEEDDAEGDEFIAVGVFVEGDAGEGAGRACCGGELERKVVDCFEEVEGALDFGVVCSYDGVGEVAQRQLHCQDRHAE